LRVATQAHPDDQPSLAELIQSRKGLCQMQGIA
jgi:hypothetical protein